MSELGRGLVGLGLAAVLVGILLWLAPSLPWLGRLPGDFRIQRPWGTIYLPITSCVVVSVALTLLLNLITRLR